MAIILTCPKCGYDRIKEGEIVCPLCGFKIYKKNDVNTDLNASRTVLDDHSTQETQSIEESQPIAPPRPLPHKTNIVLRIFLMIGCLLVIAVILWRVFPRGCQKTPVIPTSVAEIHSSEQFSEIESEPETTRVNEELIKGYYTSSSDYEEVGSESKTENLDVSGSITKVSAFVKRLYLICLEREYDQEGLNKWVGGLLSGEFTGTSAAEGFFKSREFGNRNLDDKSFVTVAYRTLLDREPDEEGMNSWVKALENGTLRKDVVRGFTKSKEFGNICEEYGIAR